MFLHSQPPAPTGKWALKFLFHCIFYVQQVENGALRSRRRWEWKEQERLCGGKCIIKNPHPPPASEEPLFHVDSVNDTQLPEMLA